MQRKPMGNTAQRHSEASGSATSPVNSGMNSSTESTIRALQNTGGTPLPASERAFFEPRFGRSFDDVRIHDGARADAASRSISARAFTLGGDIAFSKGEYRPGTVEGRHLLAHELTHTVQQGNGHSIRRAPPKSGTPPASGSAPPPASATTPGFSVTYDGCETSPYTKAVVEKAAKDCYDKVKNTNCIVDADFRSKILAQFNGLTVDCEQNADGPCGRAQRYFSQTVNIYPKSLKADACGPLEATILHEVIHLLELAPFGHGDLARACEKACFNYGAGDAAKCTAPVGPLLTTEKTRGYLLGGSLTEYSALAGLPLDQQGRFHAFIGGYGGLLNNLTPTRKRSILAGGIAGLRYQNVGGGPTSLHLDLQARGGVLGDASSLPAIMQPRAYTASGGLGFGLTHDTQLGNQALQVNLDAGAQVGRIWNLPGIDQPYFNAGFNLMIRFGKEADKK